MDQRVAVHLRGGGEQEARALGLGQAERVVRAQAADLEGLDGHAQVVDGRGGRGEMEDEVERTLEVDVVRHVVLDEHEVAARQVLDVGGVAGDEVVHPDHGVATVEEVLGKVRADEAGRPGDERARHQRRPPEERMAAIIRRIPRDSRRRALAQLARATAMGKEALAASSTGSETTPRYHSTVSRSPVSTSTLGR